MDFTKQFNTHKTLRSTNFFLLLLATLFFSACEGESPEINEAPEDFTVTANPDMNKATISWTEATDPNGDLVTYSLVLGDDTLLKESPLRTYLAEGLEFERDYAGKVIAADPEGLTNSQSFSFRTGDIPNEAPEAFNLQSPADQEDFVALEVDLRWDAATDPDGDALSYDILLDQNANPSTEVGTDISQTSFRLTGLSSETQYYWKVIAKDGKGGQAESQVYTFSTRASVSATLESTAPWATRASHAAVEFNGKMWVFGGNGCCGTRYNDVWSSPDGVNWTEEASNAGWAGRTAFGATVHDGKIWLSGGNSSYTSGNEFGDVWYSSDGITWTRATANAAFGGRYGHEMLSYNGKLWILGGRDVNNTYSNNQVWSSTDGISWTLEMDDVGINLGGLAGIIVHDNKIWKIGGFSDNVSWTTDGVNWTTATNEAAFGDKLHHACTSHNGRLWLFSGSVSGNELVETPDVWYSLDGISWIQAAQNAGFDPVAESVSLSFNGKLWLIGGGGGFQSNFVTNKVYSFN
ncbi:MAG: fibronectin type III domain-containing protein [Bacteroidota bacterium]